MINGIRHQFLYIYHGCIFQTQVLENLHGIGGIPDWISLLELIIIWIYMYVSLLIRRWSYACFIQRFSVTVGKNFRMWLAIIRQLHLWLTRRIYIHTVCRLAEMASRWTYVPRKLQQSQQWCTFSYISHYSDVIMNTMASQITSLTIVYSTVYSRADKRKHQSSASLAFVRGIHWWPLNSPHKGPVTQKCSHLMTSLLMRLHITEFHFKSVLIDWICSCVLWFATTKRSLWLLHLW